MLHVDPSVLSVSLSVMYSVLSVSCWCTHLACAAVQKLHSLFSVLSACCPAVGRPTAAQRVLHKMSAAGRLALPD